MHASIEGGPWLLEERLGNFVSSLLILMRVGLLLDAGRVKLDLDLRISLAFANHGSLSFNFNFAIALINSILLAFGCTLLQKLLVSSTSEAHCRLLTLLLQILLLLLSLTASFAG